MIMNQTGESNITQQNKKWLLTIAILLTAVITMIMMINSKKTTTIQAQTIAPTQNDVCQPINHPKCVRYTTYKPLPTTKQTETTTTETRPINVPATRNGDFQPSENLKKVTQQAFGDLGHKVVEEALMVARCESSYKPEAHRTTSKKTSMKGDRGIWQINHIWDPVLNIQTKQRLFTPEVNAWAARQIYDSTGNWKHWYMTYKCHKLK